MSKIEVVTQHPIALDTKDTTDPRGAQHDNSRNEGYVNELVTIHNGHCAYMDLGCAGGGFVQQMLDRGQLAVGLEGSDHNKEHKKHEWANIPDNLFTCDITKPFHVRWEFNQAQIKFDVISAFDVLEHIKEQDLPQLIDNIKNSLKPSGRFVCSIATFADEGYHVTLKDEPWWDSLFFEHGMMVDNDFLKTYGRTSSFQRTYKLKFQ